MERFLDSRMLARLQTLLLFWVQGRFRAGIDTDTWGGAESFRHGMHFRLDGKVSTERQNVEI